MKKFLNKHAYFVTVAHTAAEARQALELFRFDLIILDVMLPHEMGTDLARELRKTSNIAILMLTALGDVKDRIQGLESGADDYVSKPFEPQELLLRARNLINRTKQNSPDNIVYFGTIQYDRAKSIIHRDNQIVSLNQAEGKLLEALLISKNQMIEREDLAKKLKINVRSVDVQVNRLRNKIEYSPKQPIFLQTIRGKGYILYVD